MKRQTIAVGIVLAFILSLLAVSPTGRVSASHTVPVTVTITRVIGIGDDLDGIGRKDADFYAGASIGGGPLDAGNSFATHRDDEDDISPFWTITRNVVVVDDSLPATSVTLSIWDHDNCTHPFCTDTGVVESDDDQLDIKPGAGETIALTINLNNGQWTGDVNWPTNCVQGDGGEAVKVCFDISIDSASGDADGDFLLDGWERNGFNPDGDGTIDVDLPTMGANPLRKDLFLEIDCLVAANHSHCPLQGAIQAVVQSFANAPVNNVDGTTGIQLHIDIGNLYGQPALPAAGFATNVLRTGAAPGGVTGNFGNFGGGGNQIPEAGNLIVDWDGAAAKPATNFYSLKGAPGNNFNNNRALIFRYFLFVHQVNARAAANDCTSGWAEGGVNGGVNTPGNDGIVSLGGTDAAGNPCWATDAVGNSVGNQNQQAGTLQHEFGHNLSLDHGGNDIVNGKPNYLSVMNYPFQSCGVVPVPAAPPPGLPGGCDYSRFNLPALNEVNPAGLDECVGIGGGLGLGSNNWDGDTSADANGNGIQDPGEPPNIEGVTNCQPPNNTNVQANINRDTSADADGDGIQDPGEPPIFGTLNGFEDWNSIRYDFRTQGNFADGGVPPFPNEANPEIIAAARDALAELVHPVLAVDKTGPADAIPGDTLNYSIKVKNSGRGPALNSVLTDTKPDSKQATFNLGTIVLGAEETRNVSFAVPCSTTDLTVLTNSATATAEDMLGNPVSGSDTVNTTVHAPILTLSKSATASVNAGEAINYTITYENTGNGAAANVVITDILPAGVYYSKALDLGAGPQPDSVTLNADGTRMLVWNVGAVPASSGAKTIVFTARPTLLTLGGASYSNNVSLSFQNANGCVYDTLKASSSTSISVVPPTRDPLTLGFWRNHPELWTAEILARIQATDQQYDADGDGALSVAEATAMLAPGGTQPKVLQTQLLATYFNLATRRINAGTVISSPTADRLGLTNVRDAVLYATATLLLPVDATTQDRYSDAIRVLDEINANKSEVYITAQS